MFNKKAKELITATIPDYLIQQRDGGGGKKLSYISGSTVTDILNKAFDYDWDWIVEKEWLEASQPKFNMYSKAPESEKVMVNGKMGAWEDQPPVAHVRCLLTVRFTDENGVLRSITKTGYGSKVVIGGASEQDSIFKAAGTDALKKAASLLGIGLQLYRNEEETYFFNELNYEDPWTDEMLKKYDAERTYVKNFMEKYQLDEESMVQVISEHDEYLTDLGYIMPDNIEALVEFLKAKDEEASAAE